MPAIAFGDGEAALVEGPADDRALDVGGGLARQQLRGRRGSRPRPRRSPAPRSPRRSASSSSSAGPSIVPSTSIAVQRKRATPRSLSSATASTTPLLAGLGPARQRDPAAAGVDRDDDALAVRAPASRRGTPGSRSAAVPITTRSAPASSTAATDSASRSPPPTWIGHSTAAAIRRTASRFCGAPALAPSRSTTCRNSRPFAGPARGRVDRVGVVGGLALVVALQQPHRLAAADVDRRVEDHAGRARRRRSRRSWRAAAGRRRSTSRGGTGRRRRCRARPRRRSARRRRRCRAGRRPPGAARRSGRSRRASRDSIPSVSRDSPLPAHRRPADVRDLEAVGVELGDLAGQQAEPVGAAQLGGRVEEQLQAEADAEDRHAGVAALGDQLVEAAARGPAPSPSGRRRRRAGSRRRRRAPRRRRW